ACMSSKVRNVAFSTWPPPCSGSWAAAFCAHAAVVSTKGASIPITATLTKSPVPLPSLCFMTLFVLILCTVGFFLIWRHRREAQSATSSFFLLFLLAEALVNQLIKSLARAKMARNSRVTGERPVVRQQTYVGKPLVVSLAAFRRSRNLLAFCPAVLQPRASWSVAVRCLPPRVDEVVQEGGSTCDRNGGHLAVIVGSSSGGSA